MDELITNKEHRELDPTGKVGDNAKALEELMKKVDWKYLGYGYAIGLGALLVTLFTIIVVVDFALSIF